MLTEKDYCDYDTCVALKELGYKEKCVAYYDTEDNVGLLYNTQWASYGECYQYFDVLESHNTSTEYYIDAPTLWDAQKWLREEKGIYVMIEILWKTDDGLGWCYICCNKPLTEEDQEVCFASGGFFDSYEEALLEGIKEAIKILKEE